MPTNLSGRLTFIIILALVALFGLPYLGGGIFPIAKLVNPEIPWSQKHNLKPGIDMAGGTSLLYEIKTPEGMEPGPEVVKDVMQALKKRVDPDGTKNLIWRPQGSTRLEIQMPLTAKNDKADDIRKTYVAAQEAVERLNVRIPRVLSIARDTNLTADQRRDRLMALSQGSQTREEVFAGLLSVYDQRREAEKAFEAGDTSAAQRGAALATQEQQLIERLEQTNLSVATLEAILSLPQAERDKQLASRKEQFANFPQMTEAVNAYIKAWEEYQGVRDQLEAGAELKRLLQGSGVLEYHIVAGPEISDRRDEMVRRLQELGPVQSASPERDLAWFEVDRVDQVRGQLTQQFGDKHYILLYTTPDKQMVNREGEPRWALERAWTSRDTGTGTPVVNFRFDPVGATRFGTLTGQNVGRPLAIVLDGRVISAPNIKTAITGGQGYIDGGDDGFSPSELTYLVSTLSAGSLPAQLSEDPISERTVGPQLGADNLRAGFIAAISGLVLTVLFLVCYYYMSGLVATLGVFLNLIFLLGVMAAFDATFTLPGVAGIVLTLGMAVDSNVLIFERLREEQKRGLSVRQALRNAYDRAWSAIVDANVTTLITAMVLWYFGSEEVKGFGLTLVIGLATSMFTALYVTRTFFGFLLEYTPVEKLGSLPLTFPKWDKLITPNIDWMAKARYFMVFSAIFIIGGCSVLGYQFKQGNMLDIEFASGTSVTFDLKEPMDQGDVRRIINDASAANPSALPSPSVVSVGGDRKTYEVVTPNPNSREVQDVVRTAMREHLTVTPALTFTGIDQNSQEAFTGGSIVPIESERQTIAGFTPEGLAEHIGGAAIVLPDLQPRLSADELESRLNRFRLLTASGGGASPTYREFDVAVSPDGTAVILVSDPALTYNFNPDRWLNEIASPMWRLAIDAANWQSDLQRVTNFDAQVAGETKRDATAALVFSIVVIMAYIWIRFGNLRYGTATVLSLIHDLMFTLAAIGFAHLLAPTFLGDALLLEPFRVNLNLVAAVLTVLGWSMNDTVVIFDRIRENRGKYGHLSRRIINDSINQTMPRTLLTGGTTILTIFIMYVFGGPGIHGFTFALLVGIISGTYSSIAIASPFLMFGIREGVTAGPQRSPVGQLQVGTVGQ
jgi:SecD/SecF fusion protein